MALPQMFLRYVFPNFVSNEKFERIHRAQAESKKSIVDHYSKPFNNNNPRSQQMLLLVY